MAPPLLPTAEAFGTLTSMLVGKKVKVAKGAPLPSANVRCVATYVDGTGVLAFVVVTDLAFLAGIGAALAMIPPPAVAEAIKAGKPSEALVENAYEALNVAASLFNEIEGSTTHVKLEKVAVGVANPDIAKRLLKPLARTDLDIGIPAYPDSKVSFMAVARA